MLKSKIFNPKSFYIPVKTIKIKSNDDREAVQNVYNTQDEIYKNYPQWIKEKFEKITNDCIKVTSLESNIEYKLRSISYIYTAIDEQMNMWFLENPNINIISSNYTIASIDNVEISSVLVIYDDKKLSVQST
jgi:hypothetical protein